MYRARYSCIPVLICLLTICDAVHAQGWRYMPAIRPTLNATSWHSFYGVPSKCVSIRNCTATPSFNSLHTSTYTIIGHNGVRFEDRQGLFEFFEEEPRGTYEIIVRGMRLSYSHDPVARTWRDQLNQTVN